MALESIARRDGFNQRLRESFRMAGHVVGAEMLDLPGGQIDKPVAPAVFTFVRGEGHDFAVFRAADNNEVIRRLRR